MSEVTNVQNGGRDFRRQLLTTVSALALLAAVYGSREAQAEDQDADRPTVWIELGGQLQRMDGPQEAISPPFLAAIAQPNLQSALDVQKPSAYAISGEGKISFQPEYSDWIFSASVQYGRSNGTRDRHQQTPNAKVPLDITFPGYSGKLKYGSFYPSRHVKFADASEKQNESHAILDFQAGKDVGVGLFGSRSTSVVSAGVRFAQFSAKTKVGLRAEPDVQYPDTPIIGSFFTAFPKLSSKFESARVHFHDYAVTMNAQRDFRGLGPSLSWNASAQILGNPQHGEIALDWGVNAAVLFGRQSARGQHQTAVRSYYYNSWYLKGACGLANACEKPGYFINKTLGRNPQDDDGFRIPQPTHVRSGGAPFNRARTVSVPNLGGTIGLTFHRGIAKVSFGYRADFFFGAMDGGIDAAKKENRGFYGPFASISVGIGG